MSNNTPVMECHICCNKSGFCRDCCCILCNKSVDWSHGGYSLIRCEVKISENGVCGHIAHIDCALRSDLAGTVRGHGRIRLDVEYFCKRCNKTTDLIPHVEKLLDTCESCEPQEDIKKLLKTGARILRGSRQENALELLYRIELVTTKLGCGMDLKRIWEVRDDASEPPSGAMPCLRNGNNLPDLEGTNCQDSCEGNTHGRHGRSLYSAKQLDKKIDQVLRDLRNSQELEYRMAEEKLNEQKHIITTLLEQYDAEASELRSCALSANESEFCALKTNISSRVDQIQIEAVKLKELEKVAQGLGRTPKRVLKEYFGIQIDD